jgi:hypothetical protein
MNMEMSKREELSDGDLDGVNGGGIVAAVEKAWNWLWTPSEAAFHPTEACPQCFSSTGGGGARG